jgi:serine/threonine-protein kinase
MSLDVMSWLGRELADGRYWVVGKLGEGGMGLVYRARDHHVETDVVVKAPRPAMLHSSDCVQRFLREIRSLVRLAHPGIVSVLDLGEEDGVPFAVLQYLAGGSLFDRLRDADGSPTPMPLEALDGWLDKIAAALDFIHGQGFIHRDVKPPNILYDAHGNAFLSDFGLVKGLEAAGAEEGRALSGVHQFLGTPLYMAPELFEPGAPDGAVDQYALALTVYEALAGRHPYAGLTLPQLMKSHRDPTRLPPLRALAPETPPGVCQAVHQALSADPALRFPSCRMFAAAVREATPRRPVAEPPPAALDCPACGRSLQLDEGLRGKRFPCPVCHHDLTLPVDGRVLNLPRVAAPGTRLCPYCRQVLRLRSHMAGKRVRCRSCRTLMAVGADLKLLPPGLASDYETRGEPQGQVRTPPPTETLPPRRRYPMLLGALILIVVFTAATLLFPHP